MMDHQKAIIAGLILMILSILACAVNLPSGEEINNGISTAQAVGEQASDLATRTAPTLMAAAEQARNFATQSAPTIQAARTRAIMFATEAAPTVEALRTQAVEFAQESGPTIEAGIELVKTAAVDTQERAVQARATLSAAGIDGGYLFRKVADLRPNENGEIIVSFSEEEINVVLNARLLVMKTEGEEPPVQDMTVRFQEGFIIARSNVTTPFAGTLEIRMVPIVDNGTLSFQVVSANFNGAEASQLVVGQVQALINGTAASGVNGFISGVQLTSVIVDDRQLTFIARRQ